VGYRGGRGRLRRSYHASFIARSVTTEKAKRSSDSSCNMAYTSWDTATVSEMGPTIAMGLAKAQGSNVKPIGRVRAAQSNMREGQSNTREGQHFGTPSAPSRGADLLKLRI
jgi:hypothetical protein